MNTTKKWRGSTRCDFCRAPVKGKYLYDCATRIGPWAVCCTSHYQQYGVKMGQKYERVAKAYPEGTERHEQLERGVITAGEWVKVCNLQDGGAS